MLLKLPDPIAEVFNSGRCEDVSSVFIKRNLMADLTTFEEYYQLADRLIEQATKEQLAEAARLLALNAAHHQIRHDDLPPDETLAVLDAAMLTEEQLKLLERGMENLVGVLGNIINGLGEAKH
jgi:hypothetical protein